jgi:serine/threonine protein kinase
VASIHPGYVVADRYQILELRGEGGMGTVWKAKDAQTGRIVAVKFLNDRIVAMLSTQSTGSGGQDPKKLIRRLWREAELNEKIEHPNIARGLGVIEYVVPGTSTVVPVLVTEYIDGKSLADEMYSLAKRRGLVLITEDDERRDSYRFYSPEEEPVVLDSPFMPIEDIIEIGKGCAEGLAHLHAFSGFDDGQSIIHRDMKPENVMIVRDEWGVPVDVKIVDLGIAGLSDELLIQSGVATRLTGETTVLGTPAYMPLEQFMDPSHPLPMFDTYAFGIAIFQMITGRLPFADLSPLLVFNRLSTTTAVPDPGKLVRNLPEILRKIVIRATSRNPEGEGGDPNLKPYRTGLDMKRDFRLASYILLRQVGALGPQTISGAATVDASRQQNPSLNSPMRRVPQPSIPPPPNVPVIIPSPVIASRKSGASFWAMMAVILVGLAVGIFFASRSLMEKSEAASSRPASTAQRAAATRGPTPRTLPRGSQSASTRVISDDEVKQACLRAKERLSKNRNSPTEFILMDARQTAAFARLPECSDL